MGAAKQRISLTAETIAQLRQSTDQLRAANNRLEARTTMSKEQVMQDFRSEVLPALKATYEQDGRIDRPARREAWNNYTDMLCKDGRITAHQYNTWACPW